MNYQDTEIKNEWIGKGLGRRCWIELQCHSQESIRGWAFRVGGSGVSKNTDWEYGYSSEAEARYKAINLIEEMVKSRVRAADRELQESKNLLEEVNSIQRNQQENYFEVVLGVDQ